MKDTTTASARWLRIGWIRIGLLGAAVAAACAPKGAHRQTDIMENTGKVAVSAAVLRARVDDLVNRLGGRIEQTADRIAGETRDRAIRRRALALKAEAIPAAYIAAYRADPLVATLDMWTFTFQFSQYVESGAGRDAFGPQQPLVRECAQGLVADADQVTRSVANRPEDFDRARVTAETWAKAHPVEHSFSSRPPGNAFPDVRSQDRDFFVMVGEASDTIESLSQRLNSYAAQLPRQARWQAELLAMDMAGERGVEGTLGDIHDLGTTARLANDLLTDVPGLLGAMNSPLREALAAERRAVLTDVNRQRLETLAFVTAERLALVEAAHEERGALMAIFREERVETLKELDAIKSRGVDSSIAGLRELVDYALWRVAALLVGLMFAGALLVVAAYWLTLGRRPYTVNT